ncbi:MAG: HD domain-containing protein [Lachnospiraceae bacterium]|jgi:uncharacterized protein|nr:HD domain-containing protein [Lachnospiraceae bacterium]
MIFKLTPEEQQAFDEILQPLLDTKKVNDMKKFIQHGTISTYDHCFEVAKGCLHCNRKYRIGADETVLLTAAMLHDFYLYDWHDADRGKHNWHGYIHAERARRNAVRHFDVEDEVQKAIYSHMWPLNLTRVPKSKEGWILCMVDKYVSFYETVFCRKSE